jgi:hypothetical protein
MNDGAFVDLNFFGWRKLQSRLQLPSRQKLETHPQNRVREHGGCPQRADIYNGHDDKLDSGQQIIYIPQTRSVEI